MRSLGMAHSNSANASTICIIIRPTGAIHHVRGLSRSTSPSLAGWFAASNPSIRGEQPNSGTPSWRKVRSKSIPRESANVNPCRFRHTWSTALAAATMCRASSTHAPSNFPSRPIDTRCIGTGRVMSSNARTPACLWIACQMRKQVPGQRLKRAAAEPAAAVLSILATRRGAGQPPCRDPLRTPQPAAAVNSRSLCCA